MAWIYNGRKYWYHNGKRYSRKLGYKKYKFGKKRFNISIEWRRSKYSSDEYTKEYELDTKEEVDNKLKCLKNLHKSDHVTWLQVYDNEMDKFI